VKLLCVENTHNIGGGSILALGTNASCRCDGPEAPDFRSLGRSSSLPYNRKDWHSGDAVRGSDTVSVYSSKALGAPVGSCLAGPKDFIDRASRFKQAFGGGFRQAGIIAAGALYALENHRHRLGEIHDRAAAFARNIASYPEVDIDPATVETKIVRFRLSSLPAGQFVDAAHRLDFICYLPGRVLCERCFISTSQTRTLDTPANWSAKLCGIWKGNRNKFT